MIQYDGIEQNVEKGPASRLSSANEGRISLTQIWEHVTRSNSLPDGLNLELFFGVIHDRLRNPEWEVRQHALRVLRDFINVLDTNKLDANVEGIQEDLVFNLGHVSPAVRKAAVDCLRVYLKRSDHSDMIVEDLVESGVKNSQQNNIQMNVTFGIILAIPFLIFPKTSKKTLTYVIKQLLQKSVQLTHQEVSMRSLVRIKYIIGDEWFKTLVETTETPAAYENFEKLCQVYDLHPQMREEVATRKETEQLRNDFHQKDDHKKTGAEIEVELVQDKVILETEIKLRSGSAITMQIHEESRQNSCNEVTDSEEEATRNRGGIVKVLTDESEQDDYEALRRTPRRVRFGGEIVKLRTPDSDSNNTNEEVVPSSVKIETENKSIKITEQTPKKSNVSYIPVRQRSVSLSEPSSPFLVVGKKETRLIYRSYPDLSLGSKIGKFSKIPLRRTHSRNAIHNKIKITINDYTEAPKSKEEMKKWDVRPIVHTETIRGSRAEDQFAPKSKEEMKKCDVRPVVHTESRRGSRTEDQFSPFPVHNEVEMLHNLMRSPERTRQPTLVTGNDSKPTEAKERSQEDDNKKLAETNTQKELPQDSKTKENLAQPTPKLVYNSFQVCPESFDETQSPPKRDRTSQFSKESHGVAKRELGIVLEDVLADMESTQHVKIRLHGLETLLKILKEPSVLESAEPKLTHLLNILFSAELQPFLRLPAQEVLAYVFSHAQIKTLGNNIDSIALNLSKMGVPDGVRLAILLAKRIPPGDFVEQLLSETTLKAKSSKIREGALQILMGICRIFPSADVNISKAAKTASPLLKDKKRKIRHAALEVLATLGQVGSTRLILDSVGGVYPDTSSVEKERLLNVVRSRLSRKQLPTVEANGYVQYSTPTCESELEWLSIDSATVSLPRLVGTPCKLVKRAGSSSAKIDSFSGGLNHEARSNFWRPNSRHNLLDGRTSRAEERVDTGVEDPPNMANTKVWTLDPVTFSASKEISVPNGTLRPVFVLHPTRPHKPTNTSRSTATNTDRVFNNEDEFYFGKERGRSFSPTPTERFQSCESSLDNGRRDYRRAKFRKDYFRKSFSSDNLDHGSSYSQHACLSSSCSSTSTASSSRSGTYSTRIPLPVNHSERIRFKNRHLSLKRGPLSTDSLASSFDGVDNTFGVSRFRDGPGGVVSRGRPVTQGNQCGTLLHKSWTTCLGHHSTMKCAGGEEFFLRNTDLWGFNEEGNTRCWSGFKCCGNIFRVRKIGDASQNKPATPVVAVTTLSTDTIESKLENFDDSNDKLKIPSRTLVVETFSSGSDSSGYFTPPAEPQIPEPVSSTEEITREPESKQQRFIQMDSLEQENNGKECSQQNSTSPSPSKSSRSSSASVLGRRSPSPPTPEQSFVVQKIKEEPKSRPHSSQIQREEHTIDSLDTVDFTEKRSFAEARPFAKSEVNIKKSSDEQRKSVNSAPAPVYQTFNETTINITLPGSVEAVVQNEIETLEIKKPKSSPEKPTVRRNLSRSLSKRSGKTTVQPETPTFADDLAPFQKPKEALQEVIAQMESNDWELTMNGLRGLVRLKRHHHEYLESQMHAVVTALVKQIRNLRSQVARAACKAAAELFSGVWIKKCLEMELEELAAPLLQRTADTNRFIRSDANAALDVMCNALPPPKVVHVVALKGCGHPNALVRATAARLLCNLTQRLGAEKVFQMPKETRDKLLQMGANMLTDGNLDTRKQAKMMLTNLCSHAQFQRTMFDVVPMNTLRHIEKTLKSLK